MENKVKNKGELMLKVLQNKSRTKKEWIKKCTDLGINIKTFYYHFNKFKKKGIIKHTPEDNKWMFLAPKDLADINEIRLYIDQIKSNNKDIRDLGADELINLCKLKSVSHDLLLMRFFEIAFKDSSYKDVYAKLLEAFRCILMHNLKDENLGIVTDLLSKNKEAILDFVKSGPLLLQRDAIYTLCLSSGRDVLEVLYEKIIKSEEQEYNYLKEAIRDCLKSHFHIFKVEIKRKLFDIAIDKRLKAEFCERAVDLLSDLSGLRPKILA